METARDLPEDRNKDIKFEVPYSHIEDKDRYNVLESVKKIKVPVILIAGELDDIVLPQEVEKIYDNANNPKRFVIIPGVDHDYRQNDEKIRIVNAEILKQSIKTISR
ncbi:MAG: alpha/beta hydrolase [Candidatus Moranbacteria bacterium]|nr:alpha/beta hydrolase [Candidatus Moranbacteria bacterium]